jgi:hypothetical protein
VSYNHVTYNNEEESRAEAIWLDVGSAPRQRAAHLDDEVLSVRHVDPPHLATWDKGIDASAHCRCDLRAHYTNPIIDNWGPLQKATWSFPHQILVA